MKNKVLASLLAVCLFVGMAVPAFAASSQSGSNDDITTLAFPEASYTIKNGDSKDLSLEVQAFAGTKQLVQDPSLVWAVENDTKFAFGIDDNGKVTANEDAGTATVKVTAKDGKVVGSVKVNASKKSTVYATGFQFKATTAKLLTGGTVVKGEGNSFDVIPTPKDSIFTVAQQQAIADVVEAGSLDYKAKNLAGTDVVVPAGATVADDKVTVTYANGAEDATVANITAASFVVTISTAFTAAPTGKVAMEIKGANSSKATVTSKNTPASESDEDVAAAFVGSKVTVNGVAYTGYAADPVDKTITFKADKKGAILATALVAINATPATITGGDGTGKFTVGAGTNGAGEPSTLSAINVAKVDAKNYELTVNFPRANDGAVPASATKRSIKLSGEAAAPAAKIYAAGNITIEVGEKALMSKQFKQGPSSSNINGKVYYGLDAADTNSAAIDYADFTNTNADGDDSEIIGVAVGTNRVTANANGETVSVLVTVVAKGTKPTTTPSDLSISPIKAAATVGAPFNIVVKGAEGKDVTYTSLIPSIATVDATGKVTPIAAGTVKIAVKIGETTLYSTITVAAAPITKPGDNGTTPVPPTGVVLLGQLF